MNKVALDTAAKDYWSEYFKEYGQMWVRDIPRRIKQAVRRDQKVASVDGSVVPIAKHINDGNISVEAAFVGKLDDVESKVLVTATFNPLGKMETIDITRIS